MTHREGEDPNLFDAEDELDPDLDSRAYDVTRARGDADDDDTDASDVDEDDEVERISPAEARSFDDDARDERRLDEGLEESFPASDSPATHHIT
jgi:hypothetical protein